jgi:hypothetical protein
MDSQLPLTWPEKLEALEVLKSLPVDNAASVYSAIRSLKGSGKTFSIRKDKKNRNKKRLENKINKHHV